MPTRYSNAYGMGVAANGFTGIDQSAGGFNLDLGVAYDANAVDTSRGIFKPAEGFEPFPMKDGVPLVLPGEIVTLMSFYRRSIEAENMRSVLVAATENALYYWYDGMSAWQRMQTDGGEDAVFSGGAWSWVTYETVRGGVTCDVLILSSATDGMWTVYGDSMTCEAVPEENLPQIDGVVLKFPYLARHAERIWAAGAANDPDTVYYSRPYSPYDWRIVYIKSDGTTTTDPADPLNTGEVAPEESGGSIQIPTWDGDRFVALRRFSNFLLAFKRNSCFYIKGMTSSNFTTGEAYGTDGVFAEKSLIVDASGAYYVSDEGLGRYNGETAQMLDRDRLQSVFKHTGSRLERDACSAVFRHKIYTALPVRTEQIERTTADGRITVGTEWIDQTENNMLVTYDIRSGAYMKREGMNITSLLRYVDGLLFTMGNNPGVVYRFGGNTERRYIAGEFVESPVHVRWESTWQDAGSKNSQKSAFIVYFTGLRATAPQDVNISIETEKKSKMKTLPLVPGYRKIKKQIMNKGRRWRMIIEADSTTEWELDGGIQIDLERETD